VIALIGTQAPTAELFDTDTIDPIYDDGLDPVDTDMACPDIQEALTRWKRDGLIPAAVVATRLMDLDGFTAYRIVRIGVTA
jgi:hypothetical protein